MALEEDISVSCIAGDWGRQPPELGPPRCSARAGSARELASTAARAMDLRVVMIGTG
jgi:hypothetical protein